MAPVTPPEQPPPATYTRPIPEPDTITAGPFWEGAREGRLMLPRCLQCNRAHFYPRVLCPYCHSFDLEWFEAAGTGTVHTFAVQQRGLGGWNDETPFVTAYIDVHEGVRMMTVLLGVDAEHPESIRIGAPVRVEFERASDEVSIPFWRVVGEPAGSPVGGAGGD
jgi:uncharacterized OB-fold protein